MVIDDTFYNIIINIIIIAFAIFTFIFLMFVLNFLLTEWDLSIRKNEFAKDLRLAIEESEISWKKVKDIASTRDLNQKQIIGIIKILDREVLKGTEQHISKKYTLLINSYLKEYEIDEPFEGMPNEIRIHMERLKEKLETEDKLLEPLTAKIKELLDSNNSQNKKQKFYTFAGFIFGMLGFTYSLYLSIQQANKDSSFTSILL